MREATLVTSYPSRSWDYTEMSADSILGVAPAIRSKNFSALSGEFECYSHLKEKRAIIAHGGDDIFDM